MKNELTPFKLIGEPDWDKIEAVVAEDLAQLKNRKNPQWTTFIQQDYKPIGFSTCDRDIQ